MTTSTSHNSVDNRVSQAVFPAFGEIVNRLYEANDGGIDAAIFNPAAFGSGYPALIAAISQVKFPTIELHVSNPAKRGATSDIARACRGVIAGFGVFGYYMALRGAVEICNAK